MQIIINTKTLAELEINVEEALTILKIADNSILYPLNETFLPSLQDRLFIKIINEDNNRIIAIRDKGNEVLKSLYGQKIKPRTKAKTELSDDYKKFVKTYRLLWKGLKAGSMGSLENCITNLERWIKANPDYSQDDILRAARIYLKTVTDVTYLQQADYFIYKSDKFGNVSSRLSAFIDEKEEVDDGWTTKLS